MQCIPECQFRFVFCQFRALLCDPGTRRKGRRRAARRRRVRRSGPRARAWLQGGRRMRGVKTRIWHAFGTRGEVNTRIGAPKHQRQARVSTDKLGRIGGGRRGLTSHAQRPAAAVDLEGRLEHDVCHGLARRRDDVLRLGSSCGNRFRADFSPFSSCRSPQPALKFSYRSDRVTRD